MGICAVKSESGSIGGAPGPIRAVSRPTNCKPVVSMDVKIERESSVPKRAGKKRKAPSPPSGDIPTFRRRARRLPDQSQPDVEPCQPPHKRSRSGHLGDADTKQSDIWTSCDETSDKGAPAIVDQDLLDLVVEINQRMEILEQKLAEKTAECQAWKARCMASGSTSPKPGPEVKTQAFDVRADADASQVQTDVDNMEMDTEEVRVEGKCTKTKENKAMQVESTDNENTADMVTPAVTLPARVTPIASAPTPKTHVPGPSGTANSSPASSRLNHVQTNRPRVKGQHPRRKRVPKFTMPTSTDREESEPAMRTSTLTSSSSAQFPNPDTPRCDATTGPEPRATTPERSPWRRLGLALANSETPASRTALGSRFGANSNSEGEGDDDGDSVNESRAQIYSESQHINGDVMSLHMQLSALPKLRYLSPSPVKTSPVKTSPVETSPVETKLVKTEPVEISSRSAAALIRCDPPPSESPSRDAHVDNVMPDPERLATPAASTGTTTPCEVSPFDKTIKRRSPMLADLLARSRRGSPAPDAATPQTAAVTQVEAASPIVMGESGHELRKSPAPPDAAEVKRLIDSKLTPDTAAGTTGRLFNMMGLSPTRGSIKDAFQQNQSEKHPKSSKTVARGRTPSPHSRPLKQTDRARAARRKPDSRLNQRLSKTPMPVRRKNKYSRLGSASPSPIRHVPVHLRGSKPCKCPRCMSRGSASTTKSSRRSGARSLRATATPGRRTRASTRTTRTKAR